MRKLILKPENKNQINVYPEDKNHIIYNKNKIEEIKTHIYSISYSFPLLKDEYYDFSNSFLVFSEFPVINSICISNSSSNNFVYFDKDNIKIEYNSLTKNYMIVLENYLSSTIGENDFDLNLIISYFNELEKPFYFYYKTTKENIEFIKGFNLVKNPNVIKVQI